MNTETKTTDYNQQAIDFLQATNTVFTAKYVKAGEYFDEDKKERDIYEIELTRGNRSYAFRFGQSIACSGQYILLDSRLKAQFGRSFCNEVEFKKNNLRYQRPHGYVIKNKAFAAPDAYSVLACLTKSDPGTFDNFCSDFGYDTDSKRAEKTYEAVKEEYINVCRLFTDEEIEKLQEIN